MKLIFRSIFQVIFLAFFVLNVVLTVDASTAAKNLHDVRTFSPLDTYYDMLEVDINAGPNNIKRSYRKIALAHHPDKIKHDGRTPEEIENQQSYFVKVTRAHEILSDKKTRTRYDYLLSKGVLEYDDKYQDWDEFHRQRGGDYTMMVTKKHDGTAKYWFKDAFALKEDQSADFALIFSGSLLFLCITIPLYLHFKAKKDEKERQETEEAEKQRRKIAHINKIRADMARKSNKAGGNKSASSDSVKDNLFAGIGVDDLEETAEEDMAEQPTTTKGSNALTFQCSTCTKSYKTANQLKQHFESREHKKAEKLRVQTEKANKK